MRGNIIFRGEDWEVSVQREPINRYEVYVNSAMWTLHDTHLQGDGCTYIYKWHHFMKLFRVHDAIYFIRCRSWVRSPGYIVKADQLVALSLFVFASLANTIGWNHAIWIGDQFGLLHSKINFMSFQWTLSEIELKQEKRILALWKFWNRCNQITHNVSTWMQRGIACAFLQCPDIVARILLCLS